jgi:hypothetical protein
MVMDSEIITWYQVEMIALIRQAPAPLIAADARIVMVMDTATLLAHGPFHWVRIGVVMMQLNGEIVTVMAMAIIGEIPVGVMAGWRIGQVSSF